MSTKPTISTVTGFLIGLTIVVLLIFLFMGWMLMLIVGLLGGSIGFWQAVTAALLVRYFMLFNAFNPFITVTKENKR